jgi:hypothetical protein
VTTHYKNVCVEHRVIVSQCKCSDVDKREIIVSCPGTGQCNGLLKKRPEDQPLPEQNDSHPVQAQLLLYIAQRAEVGKARYGTYLQANNGRDALRDAFEEAVDLATYLAQVIIERDGRLP